jgi:hypothetical protein
VLPPGTGGGGPELPSFGSEQIRHNRGGQPTTDNCDSGASVRGDPPEARRTDGDDSSSKIVVLGERRRTKLREHRLTGHPRSVTQFVAEGLHHRHDDEDGRALSRALRSARFGDPDSKSLLLSTRVLRQQLTDWLARHPNDPGAVTALADELLKALADAIRADRSGSIRSSIESCIRTRDSLLYWLENPL